jgi:hypothetical protein
MGTQDIIDLTLENLLKHTGIKGKWKAAGLKEMDGKLDLTIENRIIQFNVEIKKELRNHQLPMIMELAKKHRPLILVAERIFPAIKEELRQHQIAYLETNGNIYLKQGATTLWIDGLKQTPVKKEKTNRAFTKTGLKVIYHILLNEEVINLPYREIAQLTDVGLGNINYVIHGLIEMGFLTLLNKDQYKLTRKKELLEKWINAYEEKLKPTLEIGRFRFIKNEDFEQWKTIPLKKDKTYWGGEPAGDLLTHHLKPKLLTLYTEENRNDIIKKYRLVPEEKGNVIGYRKFWKEAHYDDKIVPTMLVYADLLNTNDHRCIETARMIYKNILHDKFD